MERAGLWDWWDKLAEGEREEWLRERPHVAYLALSNNGCWGRGDTQQEALRQLREAGFSGRVAKRVRVYTFPPSLLRCYVNDFGQVMWSVKPHTDFDLQPGRVDL